MYQNILVPIDLAHDETGAHILRRAKELAHPNGKISLLNVLEPVPVYVMSEVTTEAVEESRERTRQELEALAQSVGVACTIIVRDGSPAGAILDQAEELGCDAIILGSHRPGLADYLLGSTAARVVRHAPCSVLVERYRPPDQRQEP